MSKAIIALIAAGAASGVASANVRITEWMYSGGNGEFIELTNIGGAPIDLSGWSYDDDSRLPGTFSLSGMGVLAPGQSAILTEADPAAFRTAWALDASVVVIGPYTNNLGRVDEINIFDAGNNLVDRLTYGDTAFPGTIRTQDASGWAFVSGPGPFGNVTTDWVLSTVGDAQGSYAGPAGAVANPGRYIPAPGAAALVGLAGLAGLRRRR